MNRFIAIAISVIPLLHQPLCAQEIASLSPRELNFVFEVKQIDEFFERFNNDRHSLLASYVKVKYPDIVMTRLSLIRSLFNDAGNDRSAASIRQFCLQVADTSEPELLDFYGGEWYAEATCRFTLGGKPVDVMLTLKIVQETNGGSKWVIVSAYSSKFPVSATPVIFPLKNSCCRFLNPMSHATNFISLSRAFDDKGALSDYLAPGFLASATSKAFVRTFLNERLVYGFVKKIRYHFLQINGWVFTVDQYQRNSVHSGWLVSRLYKAGEEEKAAYRLKLFRTGRPLPPGRR